MNAFEIGLLMVLGFLCVYSIANRICKCIETKHMYLAFGMSISGSGDFKKLMVDPETIKKIIETSKKVSEK